MPGPCSPPHLPEQHTRLCICLSHAHLPAACLQGILESIARIEASAYRLLAEQGATPVCRVLTAGGTGRSVGRGWCRARRSGFVRMVVPCMLWLGAELPRGRDACRCSAHHLQAGPRSLPHCGLSCRCFWGVSTSYTQVGEPRTRCGLRYVSASWACLWQRQHRQRRPTAAPCWQSRGPRLLTPPPLPWSCKE